MDGGSLQEVCGRIDTAVVELNHLALGEKSTEGGYIVTVINTLIIILRSTAYALDGRARMAKFENIESLRAHLNLVNRMFISLIHSASETALDSIITDKKFIVESQHQKKLYDLITSARCTCENKNAVIKKLQNEAKKIPPNLNDKVYELTQAMTGESAKKFRQFFDCLSILRNKCSHSDGKLTQSDIKNLKKSIFQNLVSEDNQFNLSPIHYPKICQHALMFINFISIGSGKPREHP